MICYVYILKSKKDGRMYIGSTNNIRRRFEEHNNGKVKSTRYRRPLLLIAFREFINISDAAIFEKKYKRSHGQLERDMQSGKFTLLT